MQTLGISPKVISQLIVAAVGWVLAHYAINLDPDVAGAIAAALGGIAGYLAPPGTVAVQATAQDSPAVLESTQPPVS